jgi:uncharacterized protein (TIGR02466 family)
MAMHIEAWFPTVIWSSIIHCVDNLELKKFAYEKQKFDKGRSLSNLGGYQSNDILSGECHQVDKLVEYVEQELKECCNQVGLNPVKIYNVWVNINPPSAANQIHDHKDSIISGVYYVDASEGQGGINFYRGDPAEYFLSDTVPKQTTFNATKASYNAKTGALLLFPSWLKHSVDPNLTQKDRISISFNFAYS